jgi:hypothetical protein
MKGLETAANLGWWNCLQFTNFVCHLDKCRFLTFYNRISICTCPYFSQISQILCSEFCFLICCDGHVFFIIARKHTHRLLPLLMETFVISVKNFISKNKNPDYSNVRWMTCTFCGFAKWILPPIIIFFLRHTSRQRWSDSTLMCSPRVSVQNVISRNKNPDYSNVRWMTCTFCGFAKWILPPIIIFFLRHTSRKRWSDSTLMCSPRVTCWHKPMPCATQNITCYYPMYEVFSVSGTILSITRDAAASVLCNNKCRLKKWSQRSVSARLYCPAL